jgi:hypothetical protein
LPDSSYKETASTPEDLIRMRAKKKVEKMKIERVEASEISILTDTTKNTSEGVFWHFPF